MKSVGNRIAKILFGTVLVTGLVACGGGDDSTSRATAEGFWTGTASTGNDVALAVLDNGETWGFYTSGGYLLGALYGNTVSSGGTLSGSGVDFNIPSWSVTASSYTGTYTSLVRVDALTNSGVRLNGAYDASYDQPASLSMLAGTFYGQALTGSSVPQALGGTVNPDGTFSASVNGCSIAGTVTPRPGGKNVFNVITTFSGSLCVLGDRTTTRGVALYDLATGALLVMALNESKSDGFLYLATQTSRTATGTSATTTTVDKNIWSNARLRDCWSNAQLGSPCN